MIRPPNEGIEVWLCVEPVDFRKQIPGLAALVQDTLAMDPFSAQPRIDVEHPLPDHERICPHHGVELERFGEVTSEQLDVIPATIRVLRHMRGKYRCPPAKARRALSALHRIRTFYAIERRIRDKPPDQRLRTRQAESVPVLDALRAWLDHTRPKVLPSAPLGKAMRYLHNQWNALTRFCDEACPRESGGPLRHRHQPRRERHPTVLPRTAKLAVLRHHGRRQRQRTALLAH